MSTRPQPEQIPGQMDVWECIEVAATGSDGKPPVSNVGHRSVAEIVRARLPKGAQ